MLQVSTLYHLFCAVHAMHNQRMAHCDLQPVHFGWFNEQQQWKLLGLATWTHVGSARNSNMCYTLRYSAPEVGSNSTLQRLMLPDFAGFCCLLTT